METEGDAINENVSRIRTASATPPPSASTSTNASATRHARSRRPPSRTSLISSTPSARASSATADTSTSPRTPPTPTAISPTSPSREDAESLVKSKSMTTEEIEVNEALEAAGVDVWETDLGEFVLQVADESPSHIIGPRSTSPARRSRTCSTRSSTPRNRSKPRTNSPRSRGTTSATVSEGRHRDDRRELRARRFGHHRARDQRGERAEERRHAEHPHRRDGRREADSRSRGTPAVHRPHRRSRATGQDISAVRLDADAARRDSRPIDFDRPDDPLGSGDDERDFHLVLSTTAGSTCARTTS